MTFAAARTRLARRLSVARLLSVVLALLVPAAVLAADPAGGAEPEGRLLRFPTIHGDTVVFVYGGDLWRVPAAGGVARRLTSHPGEELFPRFSPDGRFLAYTAEYTGSRQVYVLPAEGGEPRQLTFYTDVGPMPPRGGYDNWVLGWTPDGRILVRMNRTPWGERMGRYFLVDPQGGLETPLPIPHGGSASLSPDGTKIAFTPIDREFRTWKRTVGGRAQDIFVHDMKANRSERLTDYRGTDNFPMWSTADGGRTIYFTSDRSRTLNLFAYDVASKAVTQLTHFDEFDVLWPSLGPGAVVFMNGGYLYRYDLAAAQATKIPVRIGSERPQALPHFKDVRDFTQSAALSPSGARAVFEARGDLYTVPAKDGATRRLTDTQGVRERDPAWSPDGRQVAYLSDATGEYELYLRAQDGSGTPRRLTQDGGPWKLAPTWSPDGKKIAYGDRQRRLRIVDVETGAVVDADRGREEDIAQVAWSPDSRFLAYVKTRPSRLSGLTIYALDDKKAYDLGDGLTSDEAPVFSRDGKYLFFLSNRDFNLAFSAFEFDFLYNRATRVYAAALSPDAPALFPPKSDEETGSPAAPAGDAQKDTKEANGAKEKGVKEKGDKEKGAKDDAKDPKDAKPAPPPRTTLVPEGFVARTIALPGVAAADYASLVAGDNALFYVKSTPGAPGALQRYDLKERKEEKVLDGVSGFELSRDGKKLLYRAGGGWGIADARAGLKPEDGKLNLAGLKMKLDPRAEYRQIFDDAWRIFRDYFYDPAMHGVDWAAMRQRYGQLVPFVATRAELDWVLGEMVGELEAGHTYIAEGDEPRVERVRGGMLGCTFEADPAARRYRIGRIFAGENWDANYRSPLTEPGVDVRAGEYLLAIDGADLVTTDNPYRLLEGKADQQVVLTVGATPDPAKARKVTVVTTDSEQDLMYLDWVKSRMALTDKLSGGKVGYIHLPNTAVEGNRMLQKLFFGQAAKPALIVDDRYNGGGFIPVRMLEYLTRRTRAWWARRDVESMRSPDFAHDGPKAMLVNGYSSSGGDALPYFFRQSKLGPIIGTRTWGGLIGLSGYPRFVDGGSAQAPSFRIYDDKGNWVVENEGVAPDIEVFDLPETFGDTRDASIEKAVEVLLQELATRPPTEPARPAPPVVR